jgi:5-methylcytosine-specific restriction endonuclease McrA
MKKHNILYEPNRANCHAAAVLLKDSYPKPWEIWLDFRMELLTLWKNERGILTCEYCGMEGLHIITEGVPACLQATLDHVRPRSKGGAEFDINNLAVACRPCNAKKGDKYETI